MKTKKPAVFPTSLLCILASASLLFSASAEDWPQYLGPNRNSISPQKGILRSWPEKGPEVLWTASVGRGFGGPVVKDGKVYLLDRDDKVGDNLRCLDLSNGKELWSFAYDAPGTVMFPGSRSVPTLDGAVEMAIPAGTSSGRVLRLRGKGLPATQDAAAGDLLATVRIVLPNAEDPELTELMRSWRDRKPYDPRSSRG